MSWLYSRGLVAEFKQAHCLDGGHSVQWSVIPMPEMFLSKGKTREIANLSRYGMTCEPLEESLGEELLMWFLEDSRVKTSLSPAKARDLAEREADYGAKWRALLKKWNLAMSLWRTRPCYEVEGSEKSSMTLPRWGMTQGGEFSELITSELPISGSGYGSSEKNRKLVRYPTPIAQNARSGTRNRGYSNLGEIINSQATPPARLNPDWVEWLMGFRLGWSDINRECESEARSFEFDPADSGEIPRATTIKQNRAARLRGLGNAQVPQVVVLAWWVLSGIRTKRGLLRPSHCDKRRCAGKSLGYVCQIHTRRNFPARLVSLCDMDAWDFRGRGSERGSKTSKKQVVDTT